MRNARMQELILGDFILKLKFIYAMYIWFNGKPNLLHFIFKYILLFAFTCVFECVFVKICQMWWYMSWDLMQSLCFCEVVYLENAICVGEISKTSKWLQMTSLCDSVLGYLYCWSPENVYLKQALSGMDYMRARA